LDCDEAVALAPYFLPFTGAVFGRQTRPSSHWLYYASVPRKVTFTEPSGSRLLEVLTNGQQSIFPGSTHKETGEEVRWFKEGEPAAVTEEGLLQATRNLAVATLIARHWPTKGSRHNAALALAGGLLRAGWSEEEAANFIEHVSRAAGDEEASDRASTARYTRSKLESGDQTTGWSTLANLIGKRIVAIVCKWLQTSHDSSQLRTNIVGLVEIPAGIEQNEQSLVTPLRWFKNKYPLLSEEFGDPVREQTDKNGVISIQDIGEDFLAGTLGEKASPDDPTVFITEETKFYTYLPDEGIFVRQSEAVLQARLSRLLLKCARECKGPGCDTQALEFRFRDSASLAGVVKKARGVLEEGHDFFSTDLTNLIPCANGMLRLSDMTLLPFSPSYRRRNKLAVPFDPTAKCPLFLDTLMRPALDDDYLDLSQRWCGLALLGENLAQKILILFGTAGGGKGTFVRVVNGVIGQANLVSLRPQLLTERFELGRFVGKTLLYGADVPENFLNQRGASVLKSLTGYDPVTVEFKNSNESPSVIGRFNVIVTCNSRLAVHLEGDTDAWRRRLAIIDYNRPKSERVIADLDQRILTTEASGVLNWMLAGLKKLRADGWQLHLTPAHQRLVDDLLLESDGHGVFARECLIRSADKKLTVLDCFSAYVNFCSDRGWVSLPRNKFGHVIGDIVAREHGITLRHDIHDSKGKEQRGWQGLGVRL
jgi:P4 family phage/plasmid primase-like protien